MAIYFANPGRKFYVNEFIRKTGRYPNSVQQALKSLEKQEILLPSRRGRLKLHRLNQKYQFLLEIETMVTKKTKLKTQTEEFKPEWIKVVSRDTQIPYVYQVFKGERENMEKFLGVKFENFWFNSFTKGVHYYRKHIQEGGENLAERMKRKPGYAQEIIDLCQKQGERLIKKAKKTSRLNLSKLTKKEIYHFLRDLVKEFSEFVPFLMVPFSVETLLEKEIKSFLGNLNVKLSQKEKIRKELLEPVEVASKEQIEQLELAAKVKKYGWNTQSRRNLERLTLNYCWLPMYSLTEEPFDKEYFKQIIECILKSTKDPLREIETLRKQVRLKGKKLNDLLKKLKVSMSFKRAVFLYQSFLRLRLYRVNVFRQFNFYHLPLLHELASRMDLKGEEIKYLTYDEMLSWLKHGYGKKFDYSYESLRKEIAKRMSGWAVLMWKGKIKIISGVKNIIETMERYRIVAPGPTMVKVVKGKPACRGRVTGRVKIVRKLSELNKVEKGDVLVTKMTTPDCMIAVHKAAAIVTDEGGVTCHAAIVSREFNIPCIIGTKNATQILSDNDLVEVDANEGVVRVVEAVEVDEDVQQIYGKTACKGKVQGPVRIVLDASDFPKVQEGDILIAPQTTPEYLSSLYKVKGFVVDEDSITSHAMLYAKALRIPALIATNFARNVLHDGEIVELDATKGLLKRLKKARRIT